MIFHYHKALFSKLKNESLTIQGGTPLNKIIKKMLEKIKSIKKPVLAGVVVVVVLLTVLIFRNMGRKSKDAFVPDVSTITLAKTHIQNGLSVSGQVDSSDTINIYSSLNTYPIEEIFVEVGDKVNEGDLLAKIDTTNLEYDIKQAKNNLENAIKSLNTEKQNNQNSIVNAQNSLNSAIVSRDRQQISYEKSLADYQEAEETIFKSFDSYTYDNAINEAKIQLDRKLEELERAEEDHFEAREDFDDYTYQNAITEAQAKLDRALDDLRDARNNLRDQERYFDDYTYENDIRNAKLKLDQEKEELKRLEDLKRSEDTISSDQPNLDISQEVYDDPLLNNGNDDNIVTQEDIDNQKRAVDDAQKAYDRALDNLDRANDRAIEDAEKKLDTARNAVDDAQRAYDRAITDLERAQDTSVETAEDKIETAQKAVEDAQRTYDKAVSDLERAKDDYIKDNEEKLTTTKRNLSDAEKSLEASNLSVSNAENNLEQAKSRVAPSSSSVSNQQITLDKLLDQMEKSQIKATGTGTITSVDAVEGTNPNGVLFVIEDTNMLYVTAKVKEYNLKDLTLGQKSFVTTDATDIEIFDGEIVYISPRAVTEAGSTNVEFEIWVKIMNPNENIKIGMNAFLEIIIDEKQDTYVVPLSAIISNEDGDFIQYQSNEEISLLPIEIGIKTSTSAEIFGEGLVDGMIIISGSYSSSQNETTFPMGGPPFGN